MHECLETTRHLDVAIMLRTHCYCSLLTVFVAGVKNFVQAPEVTELRYAFCLSLSYLSGINLAVVDHLASK